MKKNNVLEFVSKQEICEFTFCIEKTVKKKNIAVYSIRRDGRHTTIDWFENEELSHRLARRCRHEFEKNIFFIVTSDGRLYLFN